MNLWITEQFRAYWRNAGTVREFRTQMRGPKAFFGWAAYVALLTLIAAIIYFQVATRSETSIAEVQQSLSGFYTAILMTLETAMLLIAPAMACHSICVEFDRQSFDLIQSAPVPYRYFLIGKFLSCCRNLSMLLVLSLPITAMCVVMGGSNWHDVLEAYVLLALHGMMAVALAAPIACLCKKTVQALILTFGLEFLIALLTNLVFGVSGLMRFSGAASSSTFLLPYGVQLAPYSSLYASIGSMTAFGTFNIPNIVLTAATILLFCKYSLVGSASALSHDSSWDTRQFRILTLLFALIVGVLSAWVGPTSGLPMGSGFGPLKEVSPVLVGLMVARLFGVGILLAFIGPFTLGGERRRRATGFWVTREVVNGRPSGALPFALALLSLSWLPYAFMPGSPYLRDSILVWIWGCAATFLIWSIVWLGASSGGLLVNVQRLSTALLVAIILAPIGALSVLSVLFIRDVPGAYSIVRIHPLDLFGAPMGELLAKAFVLAAFGLLLFLLAEAKRTKLEKRLLALGWTL